MSTPATTDLAEHAASIGADAVAVIAPPYYDFPADGLLEHFAAAAKACEPVPFFVYEFAARSGYSVPIEVIQRLRERAPNLAGLKVSDSPFSAVEPYVLEGLAVFIGNEPMIPEGFAAGAVGAVSALAAVRPEAVMELTANPTPERGHHVKELRAGLDPMIPSAKAFLAQRGLIRKDVRGPLRPA